MIKAGIILTYLLVLSVQDIRERRVSVMLLTVGGIFAVGCLGYEMFVGRVNGLVPLLGSLPGVFLLVVARISKKAGYADGIVLLWLGLLGGYGDGVFVMGISLLLIAAVSMILLVLRRVKKETRIPYIPFLTAGYLLLQFGG